MDKTILIILMPLIVLIGGFIWDLSNSYARIEIIESNAITPGTVDNLKMVNDIGAAIRAAAVPSWWYPMLLVAFLYVLFLLSFPFWLLTDKKQSEQQPKRRDVDEKSDASTKEKLLYEIDYFRAKLMVHSFAP